MRVEPFPGGRLGFQVVRSRLEQVLGDCATAAGAIRVQPATVLRIERDGEMNVVEAAFADGPRTLRAPWVLDCSGRAGVAARNYRVAAPEGVRTVALIDSWHRPGGWNWMPDETHTLVESAEWGWAWSVPVEREVRYVTMMVDPGRTSLMGEDGVRARYQELLASLPAMRRLCEGASCGGTPWAYEATPYHSLNVAFPGLFLVGDAASAIDPLSSFGVKKALASAWLAAVAVHTALATPAHTALALQLYRERESAYVQSATQGLSGLSRLARPGRAVPFWSARAELDAAASSAGDGVSGGVVGEAAVEQLRNDPAVLVAFRHLREAPAIRFVPSDGAERLTRPVVRGNVVVPEAHLSIPGVDGGVRYLRNVDLVSLADIAPRFDDVGAMYTHYTRVFGPIALPDFLGALAVLAGKGVVRVA